MADQFLSQDEVDALLEGVAGDVDETPPEATPEGVRPYDLATAERIVRRRMPTFEIANERLARNLRIGMFDFIRRSPEISVGAVKTMKYGEFLRGLVVPTNMNVMHVKPLRGSALLVCEPQLVFTIIDDLFGGSGKLQTRIEGREFSATEMRIIQRVVELICDAFRSAWKGIFPLELEYQRSEMLPQFANIATPSEIVVTSSFSLEIGESGGQMHLCIPYAALEPIRDTIYSSVQGDGHTADRRWVTMLTQQIKAADVELVVDLAHARATVRDLMALRPGDFIELDLAETVSAQVAGVPIFECRYGLSNGRYAVRIRDFINHSDDDPSGASHGQR